jgi:hypothetical protein
MSTVVQVRLESRGVFFIKVAVVVGELGFNGSRLNKIFSTSVRAECPRCGIEVTAEEIGQIAITEDYKQLPHPKLQRLRLGCCAREGCDSCFYAVHLENQQGVNWEIVEEKALSLLAAKSAAAQEAQQREKNRERRLRLLRNALASLIGLVLVLAWFMAQHNRLPFARQHHKYRVDPASVGDDFAR